MMFRNPFRKYHKYLVQINYKSGISVTKWYKYLAFSGTKVDWKLSSYKRQQVLYMGYDSIESIYVLKTKLGRQKWEEK